MNKKTRYIISTIIFTIFTLFLVSSNVIAAGTAIDKNATWTADSGNTYKYDYTGNNAVTEADFEKYAHSYAKFNSMPATWLRGKYANVNQSGAFAEGYETILQSHAICAGHGNTHASAKDSNGNTLYKIASIIDITPKTIIGNGNGRVGENYSTMNDPITYSSSYKVSDGKTSTKYLSALAYYLADKGTPDGVCQPVSKVLGDNKATLAKDKLLDYTLGINNYSSSTTSAYSGKYATYASDLVNHKAENKTSISENADRKEGTYSGTKYDYWGPFQITYSSDITTINVTTANAGSYKGIASSIGGQPKVASTSTIQSNTSFYVVTTTTTSTAKATITINTSTASKYYNARIMLFKHSGTAGAGYTNTAQNILVWATSTVPIKDTVTINVTPTSKSGDLQITKYNSAKTEKLSGAVFELFDSNNKIVHFTGSSSTGTYTYYAGTNVNIAIVIPSSGIATVKDLPAGSYKLREITAPTGYEAKATSTNVTITSGATKQVSVLNEKLGGLRVIKNNEDGDKLAGAKFELLQTNKLKFTSSGNGVYVYDKNGTITTLETNSLGVFSVSNLPKGSYELREIEAPAGYKITTRSVTVTIANENVTTKTITNELKTGNLQIFKYDAKIGKGKPLAGGQFYLEVPGKGTVKATKNAAGSYTYDRVHQSEPTFMETNSAGKITIYGLPADINYKIIELKAPEGYKKYTENLYKTVETDETVTVNVPEEPETIDLTIIKKSSSNLNKKISNVGFKILSTGNSSTHPPKGWISVDYDNYNSDSYSGEWSGEYYSYKNAPILYTDSTGTITVRGLPKSEEYEVYEVSVPEGFEDLPLTENIICFNNCTYVSKGSDYAKKINPDSNNQYTYTAINNEVGKMKIQKIDTSGNNRVNSIGFKIYDKINNKWLKFNEDTGKYLEKTEYFNEATTVTTDKTGYTKELNSIPRGTYDIYETSLGNYGYLYELDEPLNVKVSSSTPNGVVPVTVSIKVKHCGSKTISDSSTLVNVQARNTPTEGSLKIQKIDTSGQGYVEGLGFKVYDVEKEQWLVFNSSNGKYLAKSDVYDAGTIIRTDNTGFTKELTLIPRGTYKIYEVDLGSYSSIYTLTEDLTVTSTNPYDNGYKTIKVKDCGNITVDKEHMQMQSVQARNTPNNIPGSIRIKKIDATSKNVVEGIGFKIFNYGTKEWLTWDETTGEYEDTVEDIEDATELTTDSTGYTLTVTDVPPGVYLVFETNLNSHTEYPALETVSIVGKNNSTITFEGKTILSDITNSQYHNIDKYEETNLEITAKNTVEEHPENLVIKKIDKASKNVVSGIGFKIYDDTNKKWLKINASTGEITGTTTDFESATELVTGQSGYTVEIKEVPVGTYKIYETNLGTHTEYTLGKVVVSDDGSNVEKDGKFIKTVTTENLGETITVEAENYQLGKMYIRKTDTSDSQKVVDGIGFKIQSLQAGQWLIIDEETGKVTGTTMYFDEATTIYTGSNGLTKTISNMPIYSYYVYETDISSHSEYEFEDTITVKCTDGTKEVPGKRIGDSYKVTYDGTAVQVVAANTPVNKVKLSGYVWKNGLNYGKTASTDNIYDESVAKDVKLSGVTIKLVDENNNVIAETTTDQQGKYEFNDISVDNLSSYKIQATYDGIKYQVIDNGTSISETDTNKFMETSRSEFNSRYSTITSNMGLTYSRNNNNKHISKLKNTLSIKANTVSIASENKVIGTTTTGDAIANIAQIKNDSIKEITNINLGLYSRTAPDLELREYLYQIVLTNKEDTDVDPQNTFKLNKMDLGQDAYEYSKWEWDKTESKFKLLTKTGNEAKKMYVVYKLALVNSATGINNKINSITNYYGTDHIFVKAKYRDANNSSLKEITSEKIAVEGGKVTLNNLNIDVKSQKTAYVYLEFEIPVEQLKEKLETGGEAAISNNYAEIDSYTSYTGENELYAGVDKDSAPGNINLELFSSLCEDDESHSPNIKITSKYAKSATATATEFIDKLMSAKFSE